MITAGLVLLLFCVYQLFWTNVVANRAQAQVTDQLREDWQHGLSPVLSPPSSADPTTKPASKVQGFAILHIPRLGENWSRPIVEGVRLTDLAEGIGHYPETALPGGIGNFAVAGHRATHGEPFRNLDELRPGDPIVVETRTEWLTYEVRSPYGDGRGHEIVNPNRIDVVAPVPKHPGATPTERLMTLTTCHPRWASKYRLIVYAHLVDRSPKADGPPAALGGER
jgi:sortase A